MKIQYWLRYGVSEDGKPQFINVSVLTTDCYEVEAWCGNCRATYRLTIPKDKPIVEYPCPNCGCLALALKLGGLI